MNTKKRKAVDDDDGSGPERKVASSPERLARLGAPVPSTTPSQRPDSYYQHLYSKGPDFQILGKRDPELAALYVRYLLELTRRSSSNLSLAD